MITLYRSNRAEWLAALLSEQLRITPPEIMETVDIIVNNWPTSRWLSEQISITNGINTQIRFPFPGTYFKQTVSNILDLDNESKDHWAANILAWEIINQLPELLKDKEAKLLGDWINKHNSNERELSREEWQLARNIAEAYDDYILYRPDLINEWLDIPQGNNLVSKDLPYECRWQPLLLKLLSKELNYDPFSRQVKKAIKLLKDEKVSREKLPRQLKLFGITSLAPIQIEFLHALSGTIDIEIYLLTPCKDLWQRCTKRRELLGKDWGNPLDGDWLFNSPRLEASLGRMGAEFQQLLEGTGEYQFGEWDEKDLFARPTKISINSSRRPTLLEQLQEKLISTEDSIQLKRTKTDNSIKFIKCPGLRRQVQIVRDQIIQLLAEQETLQPRDILIMTPQVESIAPIINSVFNDVNTTNVDIPWKITDRNQQNKPGLCKYILELLDTASNKLTASSLEKLLSNKVLTKQKGFSQDEINELIDHLQQTGFTWGLDVKERGGDETNSLNWCLDRWLLGLALPSELGVSHIKVAPYIKGLDPSKVAKWWELLSTIQSQIKEIRRSKTVCHWVEYLKQILKESFSDVGGFSWEYISFQNTISNLQKKGANCQLKLSSNLIRDILYEELSSECGRFGHRSGAVTISSLEPMRAIPHRVIVIMGIDENIYPRRRIRSAFNLLEHRRLLGDPKDSDKDRYALLEAIMSTRDNLVITWNGRNEKTGEELETSNPIQQWLDYLNNELGGINYDGLLVQPPANPLSAENFLCDNGMLPISCDEIQLEARKYLNKGIKEKPIGLALPLVWTKRKNNKTSDISHEEIEKWLTNPQQTWLVQYNLKPNEWSKRLNETDNIDLSELERYDLIKNRLEKYRDLIANDKGTETIMQAKEYWEIVTAGKGVLPVKSGAILESQILEERWESLHNQINEIGHTSIKPQRIEATLCNFLFADDYHIVIEVGKIKSKSIMKAWFKHIALSNIGLQYKGTILIARNSDNDFKNMFSWHAIEQEEAKSILKELKLIVSQGLEECWPVPPESGWKYALQKTKSPQKANLAFKKAWCGEYKYNGENKNKAMELCFGVNCAPSYFLEDKIFHNAVDILYKPIIDNLYENK